MDNLQKVQILERWKETHLILQLMKSQTTLPKVRLLVDINLPFLDRQSI